MSSVILVVEPSKIIFLIQNTIPQKEDIYIYIGYHSIPQKNTTHMGLGAWDVEFTVHLAFHFGPRRGLLRFSRRGL